MAGRIKGITVEIGGDTTGLEKALKGVNSAIKTTQSEDKAREYLPHSTYKTCLHRASEKQYHQKGIADCISQ